MALIHIDDMLEC